MSADGAPAVGEGDRAGGLGLAAGLRAYLITGILITAPVSITIYLTWLFIDWVDSNVTPLIPARFNPETYLPFALPGLGLLTAIAVLILIGMFTAGLLGRMVVRFYESLLARMPVLRSLYGAVKQVVETILGETTRTFREAVLLEFPRRGTWAVAFTTGVTPGVVQSLSADELVNVFLPTTPNPTSGWLLMVPRSATRLLDMTIEEAIKLVVSGGIVTPAMVEASAPMTAAVPENPPSSPPIRHRLAARLRTYFITGILVAAPVSITVYIAWLFVGWVDSRVTPLIPAGFNPETYLPFAVPGLGLVVVLAFLTVVGMLTTGLLGRALTRSSEALMARMPVVRSVYGAVKQIVETVLVQKPESFRDVVALEYPRAGIWALGFITGTTRGVVQALSDDEMINVYVPTTPNPTTGFLVFVPKQRLTWLGMTVEEGLKLVISGGIVTPSAPAMAATPSLTAREPSD